MGMQAPVRLNNGTFDSIEFTFVSKSTYILMSYLVWCLHRSGLTTLTLQSDAAIKELQRKKEKVKLCFTPWLGRGLGSRLLLCNVNKPHTMQGERILRLAEMCRKLETEEEKV